MSLRGIDAASMGEAPANALVAASIVAYNSIADEYDEPEHRTTRELERLSRAALRKAPIDDLLRRPDLSVLELGCGTGALTVELAKCLRESQLVITDPAARMLRRAWRRLNDGSPQGKRKTKIFSLTASAAEILPKLVVPPDLIAAGLADPYISESLLREVIRASHRDTWMFVTLPTRRWAIEERQGRLRIPLTQTRFRTKQGEAVFSRSLALEADELSELFATNGFDVAAYGAIATEASGWDPQPEVAWAISRPILAASGLT